MATAEVRTDRDDPASGTRWMLAGLLGLLAIAACVAGIGIRTCRDEYTRAIQLNTYKPAIPQAVFSYAEPAAIATVALACVACLTLFLGRNSSSARWFACLVVGTVSILVSVECLAMCMALKYLAGHFAFIR